MTRKIKFRAWNKLENEMIKIEENTSYSDYKNFELMQYTGLKDRNGKEIYGGDIIKSKYKDILLVNWNEKKASFCLDKRGWAFSHFFGESCDPEDIEVIGNIYENKQLLDNKID